MRLVNRSLSRITFLAFLAAAVGAPLHAQSWCGNPVPPCEPTNPSSKCYQPPRPDPRCEPRECNKCTKSPCYVGSGVYVNSAVDLELPTPGFTLSASRHYESTHTIDGPMGHGWTSSLTAHLYYATYLLAAPDVVQREANITMPDGARYRFTENANGSFTPPLGRYDILVRNPDGSFDLTIQRTMSKLHFASDGALVSMTDDYGNSLLLTYDANGHLERLADQAGSGRYIDIYWGADGRISDLVDSAAREINFTYDAQGLLTTAADPLARETHYAYAPGKYVPLLASITDNWGRVVSTVTFDSKDRVTTYMEGGENYSYSYNYQNNPLKTSKTDSAGKTWVYIHTTGGLVSDEIPPAGSGSATQHTDYYADGSIMQVIDSVGVKVYFTYDSHGNLLSLTQDHLGPNAVRFDYEYDSNFPGRVISVTPRNPTSGAVDPNWPARAFDYYQYGDPAPGQLHKVHRVRSDGVTLDTTVTYTYNSHGQLIGRTDAEGGTTTQSYDGLGNLATVSQPANNDDGVRPLVAYSYDSLGRALTLIDPMGSQTSFTYDPTGRMLSTTLPAPDLGSPLIFSRTFEYDDHDPATGLLFTSSTDANGLETRTGYDPFGRPVQRIDALGAITQYGYAQSRLSSVTDGNGNVTTYFYDALKRLTRTVFPDTAEDTYTYYPDGLLSSRTDRKNQTITATYDHFKRLATESYPNSASVVYTYTGQSLTSVVDSRTTPPETHLYSYDSSYRLARETQGTRGTLDYTYTPAGRLASYSVLGGATAAYTYYPDGSLNTIAWSPVSGYFKYSYNGRGQYQLVTFPNGQHREYSYDLQGRLDQIANLDSSDAILATYTFGYDLDNTTGQPGMLGQRSSVTSDVPSQGFSEALTKFYFDAGYQLIRADYPSAAPFNGEVDQWTYDPLGNRLSATKNGQTSTYLYQTAGANPENWDRLLSDGANVYTYDSNGSTVTQVGPGGSYSFSWNADNRASSVGGDASAANAYDHRGRRSSRTTGTTTSYLYQGLDMISETGPSTSEFLFGPSMDEPLAMSRSGLVYYYSVDGLGTIALLGDLVDPEHKSYVFDAWGALRAQEGSLENPFGFTAREFSEAGTSFHRARFYAPAIGRFLSEDPIGFASQDMNLYRYASNRPQLLKDPLGLYGTNDCGYYTTMCKEVGGKYYCETAPRWCDRFPKYPDPDPNDPWDWEGWPRCTRKCLQDCDRDRPRRSCDTPPTFVTSTPCHVRCYIACAAPFTLNMGGGPAL